MHIVFRQVPSYSYSFFLIPCYLYQGPTIKRINNNYSLLLYCVALTLQSHLSRLSLKERELNERERQLGELSLLATSTQSALSAYVEGEVSKAEQVSTQYSYTHTKGRNALADMHTYSCTYTEFYSGKSEWWIR